jgi:hypothetical protein
VQLLEGRAPVRVVRACFDLGDLILKFLVPPYFLKAPILLTSVKGKIRGESMISGRRGYLEVLHFQSKLIADH